MRVEYNCIALGTPWSVFIEQVINCLLKDEACTINFFGSANKS